MVIKLIIFSKINFFEILNYTNKIFIFIMMKKIAGEIKFVNFKFNSQLPKSPDKYFIKFSSFSVTTTANPSSRHNTPTSNNEKSKIFFDNENSKFTQIYEYKNATGKLKYLYWIHMLYIYGNSILLSFEIFDPAMGYFHGLMLSLSLSLGWGSLLIIGNIMKRTVHKISRIENIADPSSKKNKLYKIEYLPFLTKGKSEIVEAYDLVDYSMSNLENFHFARIRSNKYKKIYFNTHKNIYESQEPLHKEFKSFVSGGLE
jgi:hypothetical protein